jgi:hypothetical protein
MGNRLVSVLGLLLLAACAPERGGIVTHATGLQQSDAFKVANEHCQKFGRVARISGTDVLDNTMTFDCVAP